MVLSERFPERPRRAQSFRVLFFHRKACCFSGNVVWGFRRLAGVWTPWELSQPRKLFGAASTPRIATRGLCCGVFDGTPEQVRGSRETLASPSNHSRKLQKCYGGVVRWQHAVPKNCGALIEEHYGVWGVRRLGGIWIPRELSRLRKLFGASGTPGIASLQLCREVLKGTPKQMRGSHETLASPSNRSRNLQKYCGAGPEELRRAQSLRVLFFHRNARCFPENVVWGFRRLAGFWTPQELSRPRKLFGAAVTPGIESSGLCCRVFDGTPEQMQGSRVTLVSPSNRSRKL
ncbi:hypothetical protein AXF42_Ash021342 [Apostasia shenzhenica]|uniref:Uncharacterized protein n=1 Tax=Apostasia shenzhenica TaxID=1088818 RepID=A0A2H9ZYK4_9ASPA|nr:hypothetical protein AXF42_Ash021342 [Apostasia shenzhenica]